MAAIVEISQLDFAFGQQSILQGINLVVERGTTLGLIGPNGGGKTTLIRLLLGLLEPTGGSVKIAGLPPRQAVRRGDLIGYLPQNPRVRRSSWSVSARSSIWAWRGKTGMLRPYLADDLAFADSCKWALPIYRQTNRDLSGGQLQRPDASRPRAPAQTASPG